MKSDERHGKYTDLIGVLTRYLTDRLGYEVRHYCPDLDAAGRCDYDKKVIEINEPSARYAFLTLAHELGHALHADFTPDLEKSRPNVEDRERIAWKFAEAIVDALDPASLPALHELKES